MTKDDIKKALEVCTDCYSTCDDCPYDDVGNCGDTLKTDACELIVEQENEIERLKEEYAKLQEQFAKYQLASGKEFAGKIKAKLNAIYGKTICSDLDTEDITDIIDELLKEYDND